MSNFEHQLEKQQMEDSGQYDQEGLCLKCGMEYGYPHRVGCDYEQTLLDYVIAYLCEEANRQPRSLQNKAWFPVAMVKMAIEAYEGGAR